MRLISHILKICLLFFYAKKNTHKKHNQSSVVSVLIEIILIIKIK